jgi:hypothetical protein
VPNLPRDEQVLIEPGVPLRIFDRTGNADFVVFYRYLTEGTGVEKEGQVALKKLTRC